MVVSLPRKCERCGNMMYHYAACEKCPPTRREGMVSDPTDQYEMEMIAEYTRPLEAEITRLRAALAEANSNTRDMAKQAEQLRAALAKETQRADREAAEVAVQVDARREIEVALAEAEKARDEYLHMARLHGDGLIATQGRLAEAERTNADQYREHMACITEQKTRAERAEVDLAAAREIIERITACLEMSTSGYISSSRYHEEWEKRRNSATIDARAFLERTASDAVPGNEKEAPAELSPDGGL